MINIHFQYTDLSARGKFCNKYKVYNFNLRVIANSCQRERYIEQTVHRVLINRRYGRSLASVLVCGHSFDVNFDNE